jgi:methylated-DNA-[protein]-cysteine S-methyltransferase
MKSPIGPLRLYADEDALVAIYTHEHRGAPSLVASPGEGHPVLEAARRQLEEYFAGARAVFEVPLRFEGTAFQRAVWAALCEIPLGATASYAGLARQIGRASAARAVGAANGRNPISIIVPCHRVIGADGSLTGYAGGIAAKRWLLAHEAGMLARTRGGAGAAAHAG